MSDARIQCQFIHQAIERYISKLSSPGKVAFAVSNSEGSLSCVSKPGEKTMGADEPYFIASATKLFTAAIFMQLRSENRLSFEDQIIRYLPGSKLRGIHVIKGKDYSDQITIGNLLAHTSGLPDYFEQKPKRGKALFSQIMQGYDQAWNCDDILNYSRSMLSAKFPPNAGRKAFYSDTNYQLLGAVIESLTGLTYEENLQRRIIAPLGLHQTKMFKSSDMNYYEKIAPIYNGSLTLKIPLAMASFWSDGGIVSTAKDSMLFLKAFMGGKLFPRHYLDEIKIWNRIFFPLEYGIGIMRFKLPSLLNGFRDLPELIGHSGASGVVLYYCPVLDLFISATVNQIRNRSLPYRLMLQIQSAYLCRK